MTLWALPSKTQKREACWLGCQFSPLASWNSVGRLPNVVLHTNIDRTQPCLFNPGWGSQWLKLLKEDLKPQEFSSIALEHWPNESEKVLSGLKWNTHHRPCQLCLFGKDRIFFSLPLISWMFVSVWRTVSSVLSALLQSSGAQSAGFACDCSGGREGVALCKQTQALPSTWSLPELFQN